MDTSILVDFFLLINYSCDKRGIQRALFETGKKEDLESVTTQDPHFGLFLLIFHYRFCNNKSILSLILPKVLLALLYRLNMADCGKEIHAIRVLAELASYLDMKSLDHLISYGEYLVCQFQKKTGKTFDLPYQSEQSAPN